MSYNKLFLIMITAFVLVYCCVFKVLASSVQSRNDFHDVTLIRVIDGDTIVVTINDVHPLLGENISIRIANVDSPELYGKCSFETHLALVAKRELENLFIQHPKITLTNARRDKFFRIIAEVRADLTDVGTHLILKGYAKEYTSQRINWCSSQPTEHTL